MHDAELLSPRPTLMNASLIVRALDSLRPTVETPADIWRLLTDRYVVDLDAVAALLPGAEPETVWLLACD